MIPFTWAFMCWTYTHGGSLAALLGRGCWRFVRVPQNLCLTPLPGMRSMLLFLASLYGRCSRQLLLPVAWNPPLRRARDCPSLPLWVAALPLRLSRSEVSGPRVLLSYYVARVIARGPGIPSSFYSPFLGCLSGSSELDWSSVELLRMFEGRFYGSESALRPGPCLGWASWCLPCCHIVALIPGAGVRCPFLSSRASWRRLRTPPPLLLGLRASLYRPNQTRDNRNGQWRIQAPHPLQL